MMIDRRESPAALGVGYGTGLLPFQGYYVLYVSFTSWPNILWYTAAKLFASNGSCRLIAGKSGGPLLQDLTIRPPAASRACRCCWIAAVSLVFRRLRLW